MHKFFDIFKLIFKKNLAFALVYLYTIRIQKWKGIKYKKILYVFIAEEVSII